MSADKRLLFLSGLYVTLLITSNLMAIKLANIFGVIVVPAAVLCYPFCFVVNDLINEFYGFRTARTIILFAFIFNAITVLFTTLAVFLPFPYYYDGNEAFSIVFLNTPRILAASFAAFIVSALLNSYVFDTIKQKTDEQHGFHGSYKRRYLILRSSISTFFGTVIDSIVFITAAYLFIMPSDVLTYIVISQIIAKLLIGVGIGMPITLAVVRKFRHPKILR